MNSEDVAHPHLECNPAFSGTTITGPDFSDALSRCWNVSTTCGSRPAKCSSRRRLLQKWNWLRFAKLRTHLGHVPNGCTGRSLRSLGRGEARNHDRRPGGPQLGPLAPPLSRGRGARFRLAATKRAHDLTHGSRRPRLHRLLDLACARGRVDEVDPVRAHGEPDDVPSPRGARTQSGGSRPA